MMKHRSLYLGILTLSAALSACGQAPAAGNPKAVAGKTQAAKPAAATPAVPANVAQTITKTLESRYADRSLKVESVRATPIPGLFEIVVNKQIAYTDAAGEYMLVGNLIETAQGSSLTEARQAELNKVDYAKLPFEYAVKEVRGNGALKVAVFSDPDCPYCKRLEHEFAKMTDITIYNFMMPIPSLHPDAERKAVQIVCQPNPVKAWTEWMRQGVTPPKVAECANHVAQTADLGESFGFNGTPTLIFPNGKTQSGYSPMPHLAEAIRANQ